MASPSTKQIPGVGWLMALPALVLVGTAIFGANRSAGQLANWTPASLGNALSATEAQRLENHVQHTRPGAYELVVELRRLLPADAVLFGFYPSEAQATANPELYPDYIQALALLGELQMLLYPTNVQPMPALESGLKLPPGAPTELIFALDMGFPSGGLLDGTLEPLLELEAGTLLGIRGAKHALKAELRP